MTTDPIPTGHAPVPATPTAPLVTPTADVLPPETSDPESEAPDPLAGLRHAILVRARAAGIERIEARYYGGCDSGAIEDLSLIAERATEAVESLLVPMTRSRYDAEARRWVEEEALVPIRSAVDHFLGEVLTGAVGNWYDGDIETEGEITWHIAEDRLEGSHNTYVRQAEHEAWEL